jgi:hypothetical protein
MFLISGFRFTDFFNLLKVEGRWTIVRKIYHTHANAWPPNRSSFAVGRSDGER